MDWRTEITAGEPVARMLLDNFYPNEQPSKVVMKAAAMLAKLKHEARRYWPELTEVQRLHKLAKFGRQDFVEALQIPDTRPPPKQGSIGAMLALPAIEEAKDGHSTGKTAAATQ